jgi:hypothetical protein
MGSDQPITPGTRYCDLQMTVPSQAEWIIEEVYMAGGIEHARLVSAANSTERRTLSVTILRDRRRFKRVKG